MNVIIETQKLLIRLNELANRWRAGDIDDAAYAALYFLNFQFALHGNRFASRKCKLDPKPDAAEWFVEIEGAAKPLLPATLLPFLERYHFLGVIPNVLAALCAWLRGQWRIHLCEWIPRPEEVLHMQVAGMRPVTILAATPRLLQPVLHKPDAFAFMIHDLEHVYKFFHDPALHVGQRRFFAAVQRGIEQDWFSSYRSDPVFSAKFDYVISDMNAHMMHSLSFLRAILIDFHLRAQPQHQSDRLSREARIVIDGLMHALAVLCGLNGEIIWDQLKHNGLKHRVSKLGVAIE